MSVVSGGIAKTMLVVLKSIIKDDVVITFTIVCVDSGLFLEKTKCKFFNNNHGLKQA